MEVPLPTVLMAIRAAMDPIGSELANWNSSASQPCPAYSGQPNNRPGTYGGSWRGVTCASVYAAVSPTRNVNGGIATLALTSFGVTGTIPAILAELRTATAVSLSNNYLQGTLPNWGVAPLPAATLPPSLGFDSLTNLAINGNSIGGTLPSSVALLSTASKLTFRISDNLFTGEGLSRDLPLEPVHPPTGSVDGPLTAATGSPLLTPCAGSIPYTYSLLNSLQLSYNPLLTGPLPRGQAIASDAGFLIGTSIGLPRPLAYILTDVKAALDPAGTVLADWRIAQSVQPCAPFGGAARPRWLSFPPFLCRASLCTHRGASIRPAPRNRRPARRSPRLRLVVVARHLPRPVHCALGVAAADSRRRG